MICHKMWMVRRNKQHEDMKYKIQRGFVIGENFSYNLLNSFRKEMKHILCAKSDLRDLKRFIK